MTMAALNNTDFECITDRMCTKEFDESYDVKYFLN